VTLTPSSQPFVDPLGKIGRRGFLTLVNTTSLSSESVWTILNGKVLCIYNSEVDFFLKATSSQISSK